MRHQDRSLLILLVLLALGTTTTVVSARDEAPKKTIKHRPNGEQTNPYVQRFRELDANDNGYVSLDEWPLEEAKFRLVDRNKDGRLSPAELLTPNVLRRDSRERRFRELDGNRDGRLNRSELQLGGEGLESRDRNRDGYVSLSEYDSGFQDVWKPSATLPNRRRFRRLDRNVDNRLSRIEFGASRVVFDRLDRNRDGVLSPSEWP